MAGACHLLASRAKSLFCLIGRSVTQLMHSTCMVNLVEAYLSTKDIHLDQYYQHSSMVIHTLFIHIVEYTQELAFICLICLVFQEYALS